MLFRIILIFSFVFSITECNHKVLKSETIIHLKLYNNCLDFYEKIANSHKISFKVSKFNLNEKSNDDGIQIFVLNDKYNHFVKQQQFGHLYDPKEFVIISINTTNIEKQAFLIEFFEKESENWKSFAFSYLLPFDSTLTDGQLITPVVDESKNLIAQIKINYLIIRPISHFNADVNKMIDVKPMAMMGHRGTGVGRRSDLKENILENTIEAFNYACLHKADMIELDIQLSKDGIPIIYHNFYTELFTREVLNIMLAIEKNDESFYVMKVPVKDLTYAQMINISTVENKHFDYEDNQPFETLKDVLKKVKPKCGINFEIKYPQQYIDGTWNGIKGLQLNEYIDIIVKTLYENIGDRSAIITSFHPDLCAMIHLKQNKFGVALLTSGDVVHWDSKCKPYLDPRATTIPLNTYFAEGMELQGLSIYAKDLIANTSLIDFVKSRNQSVYVWGDLLNSSQVLENLIEKGADGLIFDKIDKILNKTNPEYSDQNSVNSLKIEISLIILIFSILLLQM